MTSKILVVGGGAREHALAWRIHRDGDAEVVCAPGNAGTEAVARNVHADPADVPAVVEHARREAPDLVVVGPEAPLVAGLGDALRGLGVPVFGPDGAAARLEGSKVFSKQLMRDARVPTAGFEVFDDANTAERWVRDAGRPLVVKADGLAAGKGVVVADGPDDAAEAVDRIMRRREFGDAGARVVVEEQLSGEEVSYHVVADGERIVALAPAQDHKQVYEGDRGPNTGGMGAYSPPPVVTPEIERRIVDEVVRPTLDAMAARGEPYRGALFVGLMIADGSPKVLEYNVRFGDPECETLLARWDGPIVPLLMGAATGDLSGVEPSWVAPASLTVVLASGGYPGAYEKGKVVTGAGEAGALEHVEVFHAGTRREGGQLLTAGGRVLAVTAVGGDVDEAAERAYSAADRIDFEGKHLRRDIGWRARKNA